MSPLQTVSVALRIFSIWLGLYVIRTLSSIAFLRHGDEPGLWAALAFIAITALIAACLWFFPRSIAGKLLSPENAGQSASASPDLWLAMGCSLLGLWLLTTALPQLILQAYTALFTDSSISGSDLKYSVLYYVLNVTAAVWLVLGARGFRRVFWWAQNAGIKKAL
jgi:hypothetical protein